MSTNPPREREAPELAAAIERQLRNGLARRAGEGDLFALEELVRLIDTTGPAIVAQAGAQAHDAGYSWAQIAQAIGVQRSAAHERFGGKPEPAVGDTVTCPRCGRDYRYHGLIVCDACHAVGNQAAEHGVKL